MSRVIACDGLSACPFCAGEAVMRQGKTFMVSCRGCHAVIIRMDFEEARQSWNRRTAAPVKIRKVVFGIGNG